MHDSIIKIIIYKQSTDKMSYIYSSMYDIFIGTETKNLGFTNEPYMNLSNMTRGTMATCNSCKDKVVFTYELPKCISNDDVIFLSTFETQSINSLKYIDKPILVQVKNDFDFTKLKQYIAEYKEYGIKEYL